MKPQAEQQNSPEKKTEANNQTENNGVSGFYIGDGRPSVVDLGDDLGNSGNMEEVEIAVPPDGNWGWVVVAASFMCNLVVDGIIFTFGVFLSDIDETFHEGKSRTAWIGSLLSGFYLIVGPFVSALTNRFGFRVVAILGSILGCTSFILSAFANSVTYLYFSYGILGGIGFGLLYVPAVIAVGFYFSKKRALATGIAVCGSGIGTFIMAPLANKLMELYGWRGAFMIQAGIILNCIVFGALFRPIKSSETVMVEEDMMEPQGTPLLQRIKKARDMQKCDSMASFASSVYLDSMDPQRRRSTHTSIRGLRNHSTSALWTSRTPNNVNKRMSVPLIDNSALNSSVINMELREEDEDTVLEKSDENGDAIKVADGEANGDATTERQPEQQEQQPQPRASVDSNKNTPLCENRNETVTSLSNSTALYQARLRRRSSRAGMRPFYRDDIFFSASVLRLPQYASSANVNEFYASVTHIPTIQQVVEDKEKCHMCSLPFRETLGKMLDFSLLTSPTFLLLSFCGFLTMMGFFVPFMYLSDRAILAGADKDAGAFLLSLIGITNTAGRVLCGYLSDRPQINALLINNIALTVGGLATIVSPFLPGYNMLMVYSGIFGIAIACFASLRSIILVELLGLNKLTNAFGLLLLFQGIAATVGAPIAGAFFDATGNYDYSFYLSGSLIVLSGVLCYPLNRINMWEKRRNAGAPQTIHT